MALHYVFNCPDDKVSLDTNQRFISEEQCTNAKCCRSPVMVWLCKHYGYAMLPKLALHHDRRYEDFEDSLNQPLSSWTR